MAYSQVAYYFVMRNEQVNQKRLIKEKIYNNLTEHELTAVSLTDNQQQIYWEEAGKEFFFKGEMYDVVKTKTINGKVILYCINDKKEKKLVESYNAITKHNSSSGKKAKGNLDNTSNLFVEAIEHSAVFTGIKGKSVFPLFVAKLQSVSPQKITPPPQA